MFKRLLIKIVSQNANLILPVLKEPLNVIHGAKSFNSGKPIPNNSFLYTFDEDGSYTVASQGAPSFYCTIVVMDVGKLCSKPHQKIKPPQL